MNLNRRGILGLAAVAMAVAVGGTAFAATSGSASPAYQRPIVGYAASVGKVPVAVSALGVGASATVNAGGTLSLTVGSPSNTTYAQAVLGLPAGSVLPAFAPVFTTDHFASGSPRFVFTLANGDEMMNNQSSGTVSAAANGLAADWEVNKGSGWVNTLYTYGNAVAQVGGFGQVLKNAYIVADGDQAAGTDSTISDFWYGGHRMTVHPLYAPVPVLTQGHAVYVAPTREDVYFVLSGTATWVHFTIAGPGPINGHQGWVNAKLGLNSGVYSGLEYRHGYAVYFQPVEGQGSIVPVPGSHIGHVYFVS